ncbi:hypothetical protein [Nonomuraea sp. NPDC049784]|uniref:hypothetical protein n=1 Tax=Nonomuraea sp. NPDC049784 TaxID=3154361 RepID=UPI0033E40828
MIAELAVLVDHRTPAQGAEFQGLVLDWTEMALCQLGEDVFGQAVDQIRDPDGELLSTLRVVSLRRGRRTTKEYDWTPDNYQNFLRAGLEMPEEMSLSVAARDAAGDLGFPRLQISAHRFMDVPEWMTLTAEIRSTKPIAAHGDPLPEKCAALLHQHAEGRPPQFGFVADDAQPPSSALESSLGLLEDDTRPRSDDSVRGYSWVMVIGPDVLEAAGGVEHLRATGAFVSIDPLPEGRVFLRATTTFQEYTDAAVERVHAALAPVLPWGTPKFDPHFPHWRLVYGG